MKVFEALAAALVAEGVDIFFGLIGGGIDEVCRHLADQSKIRYIKVRHEEVAVGMADGYSRATGKIGVVVVDGGPGLANAVAPLIAARMSNSKILMIVNQEDLSNREDYRSVNRQSNQSYDQPPLLAATIGAWQKVRTPATLSEDVALAFRHLRLDRGPIALAVTNQRSEMPANWSYAPRGLARVNAMVPLPLPKDLDAIAALLKGCNRPTILAGRGAFLSGARETLIALADRVGAVLATTLLAKNWFDGDPFSVGLSGGFATDDAANIIRQSDLVLAFGASLNDFTMDHGRLFQGARIVQIDLNPAAINQYRPVDLGVVGDAKATAQGLLARFERISRPDWRGDPMAKSIATIDRWRNRDLTERPGKANLRAVVAALDALVPKNRMICVDIGLFMGIPAPYMTVPSPDAIVFPWQLGRMGVGLPVAAGAAIGRPDRLMIAFVGDGGFMAALNALDTVRTENIPMMLVVVDDGGFGAERHLYTLHDEMTKVCDYDTPNLISIARSFGMDGILVRSASELRSALSDHAFARKAVLVHVVVDKDMVPTEMDAAIYKAGTGH